eukprot:gene4874-3495_t
MLGADKPQTPFSRAQCRGKETKLMRATVCSPNNLRAHSQSPQEPNFKIGTVGRPRPPTHGLACCPTPPGRGPGPPKEGAVLTMLSLCVPTPACDSTTEAAAARSSRPLFSAETFVPRSPEKGFFQ